MILDKTITADRISKLRFLINFPLIVFLIAPVVSGCLTQDQALLLSNISTYFNSTNTSLTSIFDGICNSTNNLNYNVSYLRNLTSNISANFTNYYNTTEFDNRTATLNSSVASQLAGIFSAVNINAVSIVNGTEGKVNSTLLFFMDTVDDRLSNYKRDFATKEQLDNMTQNLTSLHWQWESYIKSRYTSAGMVWMWLFFGVMGLLMFFAYLVNKQVPIKKVLGSVTGIRRSPTEITTEGQFKRSREDLDLLMLKMIARTQKGFTDDERKTLQVMVMSGEIANTDDLERKIDIIEGLRPSQKRK